MIVDKTQYALLCILLVFGINVFGQIDNSIGVDSRRMDDSAMFKHAYYSFTIQSGNYDGIGASLRIIHKSDFVFELGLMQADRRAKNTPDDYSMGLWSAITLSLDKIPRDEIQDYRITIGKRFKVFKNSKLYFLPTAGIGVSKVINSTEFEKVGDGLLEDSHIWQEKAERKLSLNLGAKMEYALTRHFGLVVNSGGVFNSSRSFLSFGAGIIVGIL
jgi:hypothetical protein